MWCACVLEKIPPSTQKTTTKWMGNGSGCGKEMIKIAFFKVRGVQMGNLQGVQVHAITFLPHFSKHKCQRMHCKVE